MYFTFSLAPMAAASFCFILYKAKDTAHSGTQLQKSELTKRYHSIKKAPLNEAYSLFRNFVFNY